MSQGINGVKQTIKDLLNLAGDSAAYDGEIENALRHAKRLMTAYHLSEDDLKDKEPEYKAQKVYSKGVKVTSWELSLATFVCDLIGSTGTYWMSRPEHKPFKDGVKATPIFFYGVAEDAKLAEDLYNQLSLVIFALAKIRYGSVLRGVGREYAEGFVEGLEAKLRKADLAEFNLSNDTRALIIKSNSIAKVKKQDAELALNLKFRRSHRQFSGQSNPDARAQGVSDGAKINPTSGRKSKITGSKQRRIE